MHKNCKNKSAKKKNCAQKKGKKYAQKPKNLRKSQICAETEKICAEAGKKYAQNQKNAQ